MHFLLRGNLKSVSPAVRLVLVKEMAGPHHGM